MFAQTSAHDRPRQQERRRAGLGTQEVAQRRLEVARPRGLAREATGNSGGDRFDAGRGRRRGGLFGGRLGRRAWLDRGVAGGHFTRAG